jgi:hypothetical protein
VVSSLLSRINSDLNGAGNCARKPAFSRLDPLESGSAARIGCPTSRMTNFYWRLRFGEAMPLLINGLPSAFDQIFGGTAPFIAPALQIVRGVAQIPANLVA